MRCKPLIFAAVLLLGAGCSAPPSASGSDSRPGALPRDAGTSSAPDVAAVEGDDRAFAFDVFHRLREADQGQGSLVLSPYSLKIMLATEHLFERGAGADEIARVAHFSLPRERLHPALDTVDQELASRRGDGAVPHPLLDFARSEWWSERLVSRGKWNPWGFFADAGRYYGTESHVVPFPGGDGAIDQWVKAASGDNFTSSMSSDCDNLSVELSMASMSARWANQTTSCDGSMPIPLDGANEGAPFVQSGTFATAETDAWQAVELPYEGGSLAMLVVVPHDGRFADVADGFDANAYAAVLAALGPPVPLAVQMPALDLSQSTDVTDVLRTMGMNVVFSPENQTSIGQLALCPMHAQLTMHVDARGTDANGLHTNELRIPPRSTTMTAAPQFVVDRPFLFVIRDRPTGTVLYLGVVAASG